jgi:8-oxo-dGTP pyrophosphatase MutT (NUDIX family)
LDHTIINGIRSVGGLIYCTDTNRYLFLLRNGQKYAGTWSIAGGKIESDESVIDALIREIQEEINFDIAKFKKIPLETYTSADNYFCYHTFLILVDREFVPELNHEHRGWVWCTIEDIPKPTHPGLFKTVKIEEIANKIKNVESLFN